MPAGTANPSKTTHTVFGSVNAIIQKYGLFEGTVTAFTTNNILIGINASHINAGPHATHFLYLTFPIDIKNKRYEFVDGGPVQPPVFRQIKNGQHTLHEPKRNTGHITFNFDRDNGTLSAPFNFSFIDSTTQEELMFTGEIKAQGIQLQLR
ncbi:hypothetical protein [Pseudomonas sp. NPDC096950]|uniref:hypothetical protein n=1 Tax=Pseudomonas sp. NPDC096950 TaxID=3364485 RepID=UPI00383ABC33